MSTTTTFDGFDGLTTWACVWSTNCICVILNHVFASADRKPSFLSHTLPFFLSASCLATPLLLHKDDALFRSILSLASWFYFFKTREVLNEPRFNVESLFTKCLSVNVMFFDLKHRHKPASFSFFHEMSLRGLELCFHAFSLYCSSKVFFGRHVVEAPALRTAVACVSGCFYAFFSLHVFSDILRINLLLVMPGYTFPSLMESPEKSVTVRDFWKRWDVAIQDLLHKYVFRNVMRVYPNREVAMGLTFAASGLLHVWPIVISDTEGKNVGKALEMFGYFVYQFGVIFLECLLLQRVTWIRQGLDKYPIAGKVWTVTHLFGPSYLLVSPILALAGAQF